MQKILLGTMIVIKNTFKQVLRVIQGDYIVLLTILYGENLNTKFLQHLLLSMSILFLSIFAGFILCLQSSYIFSRTVLRIFFRLFYRFIVLLALRILFVLLHQYDYFMIMNTQFGKLKSFFNLLIAQLYL